MREFNKVNKTFMKSNNSTSKIFNRYLYCLIPFILLIVIYNLIWESKTLVVDLLKSIGVSVIVGIFTGYICNLIKKEKDIKKIFFNDYILIITIIIGLFSFDIPIIVVVIASCISIIIKSFFKNVTISASLYGILIVLLVSKFTNGLDNPLNNLKELSYVGTYDMVMKSYGSILSYTLGLNYYLSPILAIISFIYLFFKRSIKYNIVVVYILTFSFVMLVFGLFNGMNVWYLLFQLCTGDILFLAIFCLTDYPNTPIIYEGQVIYGIILGLITAVLRFVVPSLSVVLTLILGSLIISRLIDKISIRLKYDKKLYYIVLIISILVAIVASVILNVVY